MGEKVPAWLERVLLPQISELKGEVKLIHTMIDGLDEKFDSKIDALDQKMSARVDGLQGRMEVEFKMVHTEIKRLDDKIDGVDDKLSTKIDELGKRLEVTQRLTIVEEQLKELRGRA